VRLMSLLVTTVVSPAEVINAVTMTTRAMMKAKLSIQKRSSLLEPEKAPVV